MTIPRFHHRAERSPQVWQVEHRAAMQRHTYAPWMNLGVDLFIRGVTPPWLRPGIGLRPGGERPDIESYLSALYGALYESVAALSRLGLNVIVDVGHHDAHSRPLRTLPDAVRRLAGLPAWLVGVHCPIDEIMARREQDNPAAKLSM